MNRFGKAVSITNRCCGELIFSRTAQTMMLTMKRTRTRELELRPSGYLNFRFSTVVEVAVGALMQTEP